MLSYSARRIAQAVLVVFAVTTFAFVILRAVGDPARLLVSPEGTMEDLDSLRRVLGLDEPLWQQYVRFIGRSVVGDFGSSFIHGTDAFELVVSRLPATLLLSAAALLIGVPFGVLMGVIAAVNRKKALDQVATFLAVIGRATPHFWLAIMLIMVFSVQLRLLPPSGYGSLAHLVMPAASLGVGLAATIARLTRSCMLDVLSQDYVRTAKAKGLAFDRVVMGHALRNALIPVVTVIGLQLGYLLGGAIITETVFAWPGIGRLLISAINNYDYPIVQSAIIVIASAFVLINVAVDLAYALIDPRVRYE